MDHHPGHEYVKSVHCLFSWSGEGINANSICLQRPTPLGQRTQRLPSSSFTTSSVSARATVPLELARTSHLTNINARLLPTNAPGS